MAAQKIEHGIVEGKALRAERHSGSFRDREPNPDGTQRDVVYDYWELRVLTDAADLAVLRVPSDAQGRPLYAIPATDERVRAHVEYRSAGGNVKATVTAFDPADALASV